jgi:hypothetical protein
MDRTCDLRLGQGSVTYLVIVTVTVVLMAG